MYIREAVSDDNDELQELQAQCPVGTNLIVTAVNTPDFFARAKAYESCKVYVACEGNRIIGSAACAIREAFVNDNIYRVGYEFQYFTSPDYRRKGVARRLHQHIEDHLTQNGAIVSYLLIVEDNLPSMRLFEGLGFSPHRTLVMPHLLVYREMDIASSRAKIRPVTSEDLVAVAELLNETWQGYDLYEPASADALTKFVLRTPAHTFDNLLVLEDQGEIVACLGFLDLSPITLITVQALSLRLRLIGLLLDIICHIRPMPRSVKPGETLKQWCLTPIAFKNPGYLAALLRYVNNLAVLSDIHQLFCVCEREHVLLNSMKGFFRVDVSEHLYVKPLQQNVLLSDKPVFVNGLDL